METYGEADNKIFRALGALAGGCGLEGDSGCGAYSAASYFFGMTYGLNLEDMHNPDPPLKNGGDAIYKLVKELHDRFIDKYGSIVCLQIHRKLFGRPFYLGQEEEHDKLRELIEKNREDADFKWCAHVCGDAAVLMLMRDK